MCNENLPQNRSSSIIKIDQDFLGGMIMDKEYIIKAIGTFVENSSENYITREIAISKDLVGMKIYEPPIFAFGSAEDEYFELLKQESVIGDHFILPKDWFPEARTVISFFLPFTEEVRRGNRRDMNWPSPEWLHGRIEGQDFLNKLAKYIESELISAGYKSIIPSLDERFRSEKYSSNWSERHVAFVCGLGTFGLSKGLITKKGVAGRFASIITDLEIKPDKRDYEDIYEYCSMCGKCIKNCPVNAISFEDGKNHDICSAFLNQTKERFKPRYGCGKCQVDVVCEYSVP